MQFETERLILREFVAEDWRRVMAYQADPRYQRYYPEMESTPERAREFVGVFLEQQKETPRSKFQLAVCLKAGGGLIGNCGVRMDRADAHQADLGYEIDPEHWGRGYASEAARRMAGFAFDELRLHRLWSWCIAENAASAHVLEKLGMRLEGRQRENDYFQGRYWDTLLYGMLEEEWRAVWGGGGSYA